MRMVMTGVRGTRAVRLVSTRGQQSQVLMEIHRAAQPLMVVLSSRSILHLLLRCHLLILFLQRYLRLLPPMKMGELVLDLMKLLENLVQMELQIHPLAEVVT